MQPTIDKRETLDEYSLAMNHLQRSLRQGRIAEVKQWLAISERLLRMRNRLDDIRIADDKRQAWRAEQPHRLKALELRARFPR